MKVIFSELVPTIAEIPADTVYIFKGTYPEIYTCNGIGNDDIEKILEQHFYDKFKKIISEDILNKDKNVSISSSLMENIIKLRSMNLSEVFILKVLEKDKCLATQKDANGILLD